MTLSATLPWPPTINHYWISRVVGKRVMVCIGAKGKAFRQAVKDLTVEDAELFFSEKTKLEISIFAYPPDKRKRDLDNILKALLDALQHAGIYADDNQIDKLTVIRKEPVKYGQVIILIEEILTHGNT